MRNMTEGELSEVYDRGRCPNCHGTEILLGPRGGLMTNVECTYCGLRMNVSQSLSFRIGQILWAPQAYKPPPDPHAKPRGFARWLQAWTAYYAQNPKDCRRQFWNMITFRGDRNHKPLPQRAIDKINNPDRKRTDVPPASPSWVPSKAISADDIRPRRQKATVAFFGKDQGARND